MKELKVNLENCYGISKLEYKFDFSDERAYIIYASNGLMKTSFTKTFDAICNGKKPVEEIFGRDPICDVTDETDVPIPYDNIFIVKSYDESYSSKNMSTLLMNEKLKKKYDDAVKNILAKKQDLINRLNYGFDKNSTFETEFNSTFACDDFLKKLEEIYNNGTGKEYKLDFSKIPYSDMFNDKVKEFINSNYKELMEYKNEYEDLISSCKYFKKGIFSQYNADNISASLSENGYFDAGHRLLLNDSSQILTAVELEELLQREKEKVFTDPKLVKKFNSINKKLSKNNQLRNFRKIIENDLDLISELVPFESFKQKCWNSILKENWVDIEKLVIEYKKSKHDIENLQKEASSQENQWRKVLEIFEERFHVPFKVEIANQEDVVLKNSVPTLVFKYKDKYSGDEVTIDRSKLQSLLSGGERRALYLMNIIFELESLKQKNKQMLIICDDIAESFDYKNKYAIIEYLYENHNYNNFNFIILTHNFDFFRTVSSRLLNRNREHSLMANYDIANNQIKLSNGEYLKNVFAYWRQNIHKNDAIVIATIPFIRNIIEYTKSEKDDTYLFLTSLLHYKKFSSPSTDKITLGELNDAIKTVWKDVDIIKDRDANESVLSLLIGNARNIMNTKADTEVNLEDKIVLSIASRIIGEKLIVDDLLRSGDYENEIKKMDRNQTRELINLYKSVYGNNAELVKIIEPISLFTSENIHLNSFMYEPLIDTSPNELKRLLTILIPLCEVTP